MFKNCQVIWAKSPPLSLRVLQNSSFFGGSSTFKGPDDLKIAINILQLIFLLKMKYSLLFDNILLLTSIRVLWESWILTVQMITLHNYDGTTFLERATVNWIQPQVYRFSVPHFEILKNAVSCYIYCRFLNDL